MNSIWYGICWVFYTVLTWFAWLCELIITVIRKLAGLEPYYYNNKLISDTGQGDFLLRLVQEEGIRDLFLSLLILAVVLLIVVTFISVIKSEWSEMAKDGNNKYKIIAGAFRALINFLAVPVIAVLGVIVGNALLKALDGVTSSQDDSGIVNVVMYSLLAGTNYAESYTGPNDNSIGAQIIRANTGEVPWGTGTYQGVYNLFLGSSAGTYNSVAIDNAFKNRIEVNSGVRFATVEGEKFFGVGDADVDKLNAKLYAGKTLVFSYQDTAIVSYFYDITGVNYLLGFIVLFFLTKTLILISYGLVKRMFYMAILIVISPPVVAVTPLQPKALQKWREYFVKQTLSIYGTVVAFNLFFLLMPYIQKFQLFNPIEEGFWQWLPIDTINSYITMLFIVAGVLVIQDFSHMINDIIGAGDLESTDKNGNSLWGKALNTTNKTIGSVAGFAPKVVAEGFKFRNDRKHQGMNEALKSRGFGSFKDGLKTIGKGIDNTFKKLSPTLHDGTTALLGKDGSNFGGDAINDIITTNSTTKGQRKAIKSIQNQMRNLKQQKTLYENDGVDGGKSTAQLAADMERWSTLSAKKALTTDEVNELEGLNKIKAQLTEDQLNKISDYNGAQRKIDELSDTKDALKGVYRDGDNWYYKKNRKQVSAEEADKLNSIISEKGGTIQADLDAYKATGEEMRQFTRETRNWKKLSDDDLRAQVDKAKSLLAKYQASLTGGSTMSPKEINKINDKIEKLQATIDEMNKRLPQS